MSKYSSGFFTGVIIILTVFMLVNPRETVAAASFGLQLWYSTVFPALFPFFIASELLVRLRFVHTVGRWLEPIMRPLFNLPGCSSLALVMGFASGFPVGAIITRNLYEKQMLTADEAERLVVFTNNSSPLFIVGVIGVGMFGSPQIGYLLAAAHYLSNLSLGILGRFKQPLRFANQQTSPYPDKVEPDSGTDSIGKILGSSINSALNNILAVGGFITVFSVLTRMLSYWGFLNLIAANLVKLLAGFNLTYPLAYGLSTGIFEITLGTQAAAAGDSFQLLPTLLVVSAILAFSGLSIIAQVMSIVADIPIRLSFYLFNRFVQIGISITITFIAYRLFLTSTASTFSLQSLPVYKALYFYNVWTLSLYSITAGLILILCILGVSLYKRS